MVLLDVTDITCSGKDPQYVDAKQLFINKKDNETDITVFIEVLPTIGTLRVKMCRSTHLTKAKKY